MSLKSAVSRFLMILAVVVSVAQAADPPTASTAYKWVDAEGNVQFSDKNQRPANSDVETINLTPTSPVTNSADEQLAQISHKKCENASRIVDALSKSNSTTVNTLDDNGEERPMTVLEREDLMIKQKALMERHCPP
jgi:uncharacterized protein DUF4124